MPRHTPDLVRSRFACPVCSLHWPTGCLLTPAWLAPLLLVVSVLFGYPPAREHIGAVSVNPNFAPWRARQPVADRCIRPYTWYLVNPCQPEILPKSAIATILQRYITA